MVKYLSSSEANIIDQKLLDIGFSIDQLVEMAGQAVFEAFINIVGIKIGRILMIIGPGNNGADGLVMARFLCISGHNVDILTIEKKLSPLNTKLLAICRNLGIAILEDFPNIEYDYIIDSVFGFNYFGKLRGEYKEILQWLSNQRNIISIDVPSGCESDEKTDSHIFQPNFIISIVGPKLCCKNFRCYVARSFVPKNVFYDPTYTNYYQHIEIEKQ